MRRNEGTIDRAIRATLGIVAIVAAFVVGQSPLAVVLGIVAAVLLFTAAVGFCPLYRLLGVTTCPVPRQQSGA